MAVQKMRESDPRRPTRERVRELSAQGWGARDIAAKLDLSVQRVYQHLKAIREDGAA